MTKYEVSTNSNTSIDTTDKISEPLKTDDVINFEPPLKPNSLNEKEEKNLSKDEEQLTAEVDPKIIKDSEPPKDTNQQNPEIDLSKPDVEPEANKKSFLNFRRTPKKTKAEEIQEEVPPSGETELVKEELPQKSKTDFSLPLDIISTDAINDVTNDNSSSSTMTTSSGQFGDESASETPSTDLSGTRPDSMSSGFSVSTGEFNLSNEYDKIASEVAGSDFDFDQFDDEDEDTLKRKNKKDLAEERSDSWVKEPVYDTILENETCLESQPAVRSSFINPFY